ncbi:MAG: hypothetical protein RL338_1437 [Chloroflexota bacterium]|jgi:ribosomal silencing factor RsfS
MSRGASDYVVVCTFTASATKEAIAALVAEGRTQAEQL